MSMNEQQNPAVRMQSLIKNYMRDLGNGAMISYSQIVFITVNTEPSAQQLSSRDDEVLKRK
jgi:hypothetical protein